MKVPVQTHVWMKGVLRASEVGQMMKWEVAGPYPYPCPYPCSCSFQNQMLSLSSSTTTLVRVMTHVRMDEHFVSADQARCRSALMGSSYAFPPLSLVSTVVAIFKSIHTGTTLLAPRVVCRTAC